MVRRTIKGGVVNKDQLGKLPKHLGKHAVIGLKDSKSAIYKYFGKNTASGLLDLLPPILQRLNKEKNKTDFSEVIPKIISNLGKSYIKGATEVGARVLSEVLKPIETVFLSERLLDDPVQKKEFSPDYSQYKNTSGEKGIPPPQHSPYSPQYQGGSNFRKKKAELKKILKDIYNDRRTR